MGRTFSYLVVCQSGFSLISKAPAKRTDIVWQTFGILLVKHNVRQFGHCYVVDNHFLLENIFEIDKQNEVDKQNLKCLRLYVWPGLKVI